MNFQILKWNLLTEGFRILSCTTNRFFYLQSGSATTANLNLMTSVLQLKMTRINLVSTKLLTRQDFNKFTSFLTSLCRFLPRPLKNIINCETFHGMPFSSFERCQSQPASQIALKAGLAVLKHFYHPPKPCQQNLKTVEFSKLCSLYNYIGLNWR